MEQQLEILTSIELRFLQFPQIMDYFDRGMEYLGNVKGYLTRHPAPATLYLMEIERVLREQAKIIADNCIKIEGEIQRRRELN